MIAGVPFSLFTRILTIGAGLCGSILTARTLGVRGQGEYYYILTFAMLAIQFASLGLASSNTYALATDHALLPRLAANSFWVSVVVGVVCAAGIVASEIHRNGESALHGPIWFLIVMVPGMLYGLLASNLLIGLSLIRQYNYFQLGSTAFQLVAIAFVAWQAMGVKAFLSVNAATIVLGAGMLAVMLRRLEPLSWKFDWRLLRSNFSYAARAYLATLFGFCIARAAVVLLDRYSGKSEIGIYSVALQFADALTIVPNTVAMVLFPDLLKGAAEKRFWRTMEIVGKMALLMCVLCVVTAVVVRWFIPLFFGEAFAESVRVLWYMLPGVFALSLATIVSQYLASRGIPPANILAWLGGLVVVLVAGSVVIPKWGSVGAAACSSFAYIAVTVALAAIALRHARAGIQTGT